MWVLPIQTKPFLKPILLPNPLLHFVGDAIQLRSKLAIGSPISQFATAFDLALNLDQEIVCFFHWVRN
jgi:hypothetical protein